MNITIQRFHHLPDRTIGMLYIDNVGKCYTLEDEYRETKVMHHTRIPEGSYEIKFRKVGRFHKKYSKRFKDIHKGMLELQDVPNFKYILIHCGNTNEDTSGCILLGKGVSSNKTLMDSTGAYREVYPIIAAAIERGEKVMINITSINFNRL